MKKRLRYRMLDKLDEALVGLTSRENMTIWLVFRLPRRFIYWSVVRAFAEATTSVFSDRHPDDLNYSDIMNSWEANEAIEELARRSERRNDLLRTR